MGDRVYASSQGAQKWEEAGRVLPEPSEGAWPAEVFISDSRPPGGRFCRSHRPSVETCRGRQPEDTRQWAGRLPPPFPTTGYELRAAETQH